jgi:hypothetical protein
VHFYLGIVEIIHVAQALADLMSVDVKTVISYETPFVGSASQAQYFRSMVMDMNSPFFMVFCFHYISALLEHTKPHLVFDLNVRKVIVANSHK